MTDPVNSFHTNFGRFYAHPKFALERLRRSAIGAQVGEVRNNDPYAPRPSVTNIIGMMHKDFLAPFYAKLVAEYAVENLEALQGTLKRFGPKVAVGMLKALPNQSHPNAAIGDEVHAWIDALIKDEPTTPLTTNTAGNMCAQFVNFLDVARPDIVRSEYTVWSYEHGYAGTGDLMWNLWDGLWIVDTKTGNNVHPEVALQTSAIAHADVILDANGNEHPMPAAGVQGVLHVRPRSVKLYQLYKTDEAWETFLACKRIFDWKRFDCEQVFQEPYKTEKTKEDA